MLDTAYKFTHIASHAYITLELQWMMKIARVIKATPEATCAVVLHRSRFDAVFFFYDLYVPNNEPSQERTKGRCLDLAALPDVLWLSEKGNKLFLIHVS
jgi:hypothetical protein